jgi:hypothetical protein
VEKTVRDALKTHSQGVRDAVEAEHKSFIGKGYV